VSPNSYPVWIEFVLLCTVNLKTEADVATGVSKDTVNEDAELVVRVMPEALVSNLNVLLVSATMTSVVVEL
jgi:hypothetical protein